MLHVCQVSPIAKLIILSQHLLARCLTSSLVNIVLPKMQWWNSDSLRNFKSVFRRSLLLQGLSSTAQTLFKGHNKMLQQLLSLCVGGIPMLCSAPDAVQAL